MTLKSAFKAIGKDTTEPCSRTAFDHFTVHARFRTDRRLFFHNPVVIGCVVTGTIAKVAPLAGRGSLQ
jgi:hypothetical protein